MCAANSTAIFIRLQYVIGAHSCAPLQFMYLIQLKTAISQDLDRVTKKQAKNLSLSNAYIHPSGKFENIDFILKFYNYLLV